jgi:DNA-binding NtrC family response regulator
MSATFATPVRTGQGRGWPLPAAADLDTSGSTSPGDNGGAKGRARKAGKESPEEKRARILEALMECGGNNTEAAKLLGVSRRTLGKWLELYDIPRPRKKNTKS